MPNTWMVRAGRAGRFFDDFRDRSIVSIGWAGVGDLTGVKSRDDMLAAVREVYPAFREQAAVMTAGQLFRFAREFEQGDRVVTYDPRARVYLCGTIAGAYSYHPNEESEEFLNQRPVTWDHEVPRDSLSSPAQNSLGAISTIFRVPPSVSAELWGEGKAQVPANLVDSRDYSEADAGVTVERTDEEMISLAIEAIKDRIAELSWPDMQELVAGLLRAMGYKTNVSPPGPDRGKDIVASPDGFGFQDPRIIVEVKHRRTERMGSQEIRSFVGGRHPQDKGLYVSTGGFSKEAYYEAERANIPLTLMDFESLVEAILEYYSSFDEETKQLLPLRRIYWPIG